LRLARQATFSNTKPWRLVLVRKLARPTSSARLKNTKLVHTNASPHSLPRSLKRTHSLTHSASCTSATREALLKHALTALREATGSQSEGLSTKNVSLGIVGADEQFHLLTAEELEPLVR